MSRLSNFLKYLKLKKKLNFQNSQNFQKNFQKFQYLKKNLNFKNFQNLPEKY